MKKWYFKTFSYVLSVSTDKKVCNFLNQLENQGITPENIKMVNFTSSWVTVYYFHDREI